ncbi:hypothetical protein GCK72_010454 [Caenorhabditis remanei]|uniref:Uncharacterized protein n=1 Tax=Caenorhabditis remanei TaxID=31234 RepID=A0A6A5H747_CAERE|nr:hypothetical protein GCK72_010454 [Caenorhabditis remanei]KAF1762192.1 hypothetical protein GCK72_010454 [Caenorhabditis remanei]
MMRRRIFCKLLCLCSEKHIEGKKEISYNHVVFVNGLIVQLHSPRGVMSVRTHRPSASDDVLAGGVGAVSSLRDANNNPVKSPGFGKKGAAE